MQIFRKGITIFIGFLFLWAALSKITDMSAFIKTLEPAAKSVHLTADYAVVFANVIAALELTIAGALFSRRLVIEALTMALGSLCIFLVWQIHITINGSDAGCGCFRTAGNILPELSPGWRIVRGTCLVMLTGVSLALERRCSARSA